MLPGGSGTLPPIVAQLAGPGTIAFSPASRVSISELLGIPWLLDGGKLSEKEFSNFVYGDIL